MPIPVGPFKAVTFRVKFSGKTSLFPPEYKLVIISENIINSIIDFFIKTPLVAFELVPRCRHLRYNSLPSSKLVYDQAFLTSKRRIGIAKIKVNVFQAVE